MATGVNSNIHNSTDLRDIILRLLPKFGYDELDCLAIMSRFKSQETTSKITLGPVTVTSAYLSIDSITIEIRTIYANGQSPANGRFETQHWILNTRHHKRAPLSYYFSNETGRGALASTYFWRDVNPENEIYYVLSKAFHQTEL